MWEGKQPTYLLANEISSTPFKFSGGEAHTVFDIGEAEIDTLESVQKISASKVRLQGTASKPLLAGDVRLARATLVHYLGRYSVSNGQSLTFTYNAS